MRFDERDSQFIAKAVLLAILQKKGAHPADERPSNSCAESN